MKTIASLIPLLAISAYAQGPLAPPSGVPAPTQKSLQEIWDKIETLEQENTALRQEVALNQEATVTGLEALFVDQNIPLPWKEAQTGITDRLYDVDFSFHPVTGWPVIAALQELGLTIWQNTGTTWSETEIPASISTGTGKVALSFSQGRICVAYLDDDSVMFAYDSTEGTFTVETVGQSNSTTAHLDLTRSDSTGEMAISYLSDSDDVAYASKPTYNSTDPWISTTVDSSGDGGANTSTFFDNTGFPNIVYQDISTTELKGARRASDGSWNTFLLDASPGAGADISADTVGSGGGVTYSAVAYTNSVDRELKFLSYTGDGSFITIETISTQAAGSSSLSFVPDPLSVAYVRAANVNWAVKPTGGTWEVSIIPRTITGNARAVVLDYREDGRPAIAVKKIVGLNIWHPGLFPSLK